MGFFHDVIWVFVSFVISLDYSKTVSNSNNVSWLPTWALKANHIFFQQPHKNLTDSLGKLAQSIALLQDQRDSLAVVALQHCKGPDLPAAKTNGLCLSLERNPPHPQTPSKVLHVWEKLILFHSYRLPVHVKNTIKFSLFWSIKQLHFWQTVCINLYFWLFSELLSTEYPYFCSVISGFGFFGCPNGVEIQVLLILNFCSVL